MDRGYIKLWRKTINSAIFENPCLFKLWVLCLLKANHKQQWISIPGILEPIKVKPGQFLTGRFELHQEYYRKNKKNNKSPLTVWRWLKILEKLKNLNIKSYSKYSIITITNWNEYQGDEQHVNNTRTTREQHMNTNKNDNNEKETRKKDLSLKCLKCPQKEIQALYHKLCPTLPPIKEWTKERARNLRMRWTEKPERQNIVWWENYFKDVAKTSFLCGKNKRSWRANIDFLLRKSKMVAILEGKYKTDADFDLNVPKEGFTL